MGHIQVEIRQENLFWPGRENILADEQEGVGQQTNVSGIRPLWIFR